MSKDTGLGEATTQAANKSVKILLAGEAKLARSDPKNNDSAIATKTE